MLGFWPEFLLSHTVDVLHWSQVPLGLGLWGTWGWTSCWLNSLLWGTRGFYFVEMSVFLSQRWFTDTEKQLSSSLIQTFIHPGLKIWCFMVMDLLQEEKSAPSLPSMCWSADPGAAEILSSCLSSDWPLKVWADPLQTQCTPAERQQN